MALHYDWTKTPYHTDIPESLKYAGAMSTMLVGVGDLSTPKGFAEYCLRLKAWEAWFGSLYLGEEGSGVKKLSDQAHRLVGLRTNVTLEPRSKWFKRMQERYVTECHSDDSGR